MRFNLTQKFSGVILFLALGTAPPAARADVYIMQKNHTDGFSMMGQDQPARDDVFVTWMGKDRARMDHGEDTSIILRMDRNALYIINHADMTYLEAEIGGKEDILSSVLAAADLSSEEQAQAKKMMRGLTSMMKPKVSVTETGETKKIKDWNCTKYGMTMSMMGATTVSEVWATEDIKIDYGLYRGLTFSMMGGTPGVEDMLKEMEKIKGLVVLSTGTMSMMGKDVNSTQELVEVSEKSAPAAAYEIPTGYKKQGK